MSNKRARTEVSPMSKGSGFKGNVLKINDEFLAVKMSNRQQAMESITASFHAKLGELDRNNKNFDKHLAFLVGETLRLYVQADQLYGSNTNHIVISMGSNDTNQLGLEVDEDEDKEIEYKPTIVSKLSGVGIKAAAAGGIISAVLTSDGTVYTFGSSDDGALGRETASDLEESIPAQISQKLVEKQDQGKFVMVKAGDSHILYLTIDGNVYQSGMMKDGDSGKFRIVENPADCVGCNLHPVKVRGLKQPVISIECGNSMAAAIMQDGSLRTWGMGHSGELARSADMTDPILNKNGEKTYEIGTGFYKDRTTGAFNRPLIQDKFLTPRPPIWAGGLTNMKVLSVACGGGHMVVCARGPEQFESNVYSSGLNQYGQLGLGDEKNRHELTLVETLEGKNIAQVAAGGFHSMALDILGSVIFSWGRSDYGQLGLGNAESAGSCESTPKLVAFPDREPGLRFVQIDCGESTSLAVSDRGAVYTWGFGETAATGHEDSTVDFLRPRKLTNFENADKIEYNVVAAAGGGQHSLLLVEAFSKTQEK